MVLLRIFECYACVVCLLPYLYVSWLCRQGGGGNGSLCYFVYILCSSSNMGLCASKLVSLICGVLSDDFINVIFLKCVQILSLPYFYNFHGVFNCAISMSGVQHVTWISSVAVTTFYVIDVFLVCSVKGSSCLSDILHWTIQAFHLINPAFIVFICVCGLNIFCMDILCVEGHFYFRGLEEVCGYSCFLFPIRKCDPLCFLILCISVCYLVFYFSGWVVVWLSLCHICYYVICFW
jgi:hypothetical protein